MNRQRITNFCAAVLLLLTLISFIDANPALQENHPPVVKLLSPKNDVKVEWNTPVQYKIKVSDPEDGESAFAEITANEVFLEVRYFNDAAKATAALGLPPAAEPAGLGLIKGSNCLNCHAFTGKLIGPSFFEISRRYPQSTASVDSLVKHIRNGSTGIWGNVTMPTHPELSKTETADMVSWILRHGAETSVTYYRGTEGYFTNKPTSSANDGGAFIVTASYTDHGLKETAKQRKTGTDRVLVLTK